MPLPASRPRRAALLLLAAAYLAAGVLHLAVPRPFIAITPPWVPQAAAVIALTGIAEVAGALALMADRTRRLAGITFALYALAVFPANIAHAAHDLSTGTGLGWAYHYPRLFAQPFLCWWALWAAGVVDVRIARAGGAAGPSPRP
jgi:uncharacterized membrane protein